MSELHRLPGPTSEIWEWQLQGRCRGLDSDLFFHPDGDRGPSRSTRERAAQAICADCPVIAQCARQSLASREPYGVWGGLTESDRDDILSGRRPAPAYVPAAATA
ncbi:MAG TPA: WhiB family transcriptional regulator [Mycobacteriales bacterium]|nr:WhiB family transcriptional regulator [Mycobacteriales bacterium]